MKAHAKTIHICNSHKPTLQPKIAKEYALPTQTEEKVRPHNNVYKLLDRRRLIKSEYI
jgi:hypothetical protein